MRLMWIVYTGNKKRAKHNKENLKRKIRIIYIHTIWINLKLHPIPPRQDKKHCRKQEIPKNPKRAKEKKTEIEEDAANRRTEDDRSEHRRAGRNRDKRR